MQTQENTIIIKNDQNEINLFVEQIINQDFKNNLILDLSETKNIKIADFKSFLEVEKKQKKQKKSLVLVAVDIDFNKISDKLNVVPSLQEAHDLIEMEEIERDLGF